MALLPRQDAVDQICRVLRPVPQERVSLTQALGRITAQSIQSTRDLPPADNSAMDGYALRASDTAEATETTPVSLSIIEEIPAGHTPQRTINAGQASRIFTGGVIPPGADTIVIQENTRRPTEHQVDILQPGKAKAHIRWAGEDVRCNTELLKAGTKLGAGEIAMLAAQGIDAVSVHKKPVVAIIPTGSELCELGKPLGPAQIYNSNALMLEAQVAQAGAIPKRMPIVPDNPESLWQALSKAASESDLILTTGGVSVGSFDYVKHVLEEKGRVSFWKVAIKPGKPLAFGTIEETPLIGLPGNPVSAYVCFELFAKPGITTLCGQPLSEPRTVRAKLSKDVSQNTTREQFLRAQLLDAPTGYTAQLNPHQGSGQLSSLLNIGCLVQVPIGSGVVKEGSMVSCIVLPDASN